MEPTVHKKQRPTLAVVAATAGTSVPTVSKVLRGGTDVSDATRRRVMQAAHELGYVKSSRPTTPAAPYRPALVDLVMSNIDGSYANRVLSGVEGAATATGSDVVITIARHDRDWVNRLLRRPSEGAVIVLVDTTAAQLSTLRAGRIPLVLIDPMSTPPADIASVGVSNWEGGRTAAEHLLALGHRRFGVIGGEQRHRYSTARVDGFRSAVAAAGGALPAPFVTHGTWDRVSGREESRPLLESPDRPTAIFACSDLMALGIYDTARELGLRIPEDLSIVGFDDVPEAEWATPGLTTVAQPIAEMGAAALRMLLRVGSSDDASLGARPAPREELATGLVIRESTAPPLA